MESRIDILQVVQHPTRTTQCYTRFSSTRNILNYQK